MDEHSSYALWYERNRILGTVFQCFSFGVGVGFPLFAGQLLSDLGLCGEVWFVDGCEHDNFEWQKLPGHSQSDAAFPSRDANLRHNHNCELCIARLK